MLDDQRKIYTPEFYVGGFKVAYRKPWEHYGYKHKPVRVVVIPEAEYRRLKRQASVYVRGTKTNKAREGGGK